MLTDLRGILSSAAASRGRALAAKGKSKSEINFIVCVNKHGDKKNEIMTVAMKVRNNVCPDKISKYFGCVGQLTSNLQNSRDCYRTVLGAWTDPLRELKRTNVATTERNANATKLSRRLALVWLVCLTWAKCASHMMARPSIPWRLGKPPLHESTVLQEVERKKLGKCFWAFPPQ
jgi:hypothetical protein